MPRRRATPSCCWSATSPITAASASSKSPRDASPCRARSITAGSSSSSWSRARSKAYRARSFPTGARREPDAPSLRSSHEGRAVPVDQQYYREVASGSTAEKLLIAARDRIFQDFIARMQPSAADEILDVGVSDVINDGANVLERSYPHQHKITACGLGEGLGFKAAFPLCRYVQIEPNTRLPFDDNAFDVATSNAVLEHAGSHGNQVLLVEELCRVARRVFITVPNRFFPVEHHTAIPLAHYLDGTFRVACMIAGKSEWTDEQNLILMTRKRLLGLAAKSSTPKSAAVGYTGLSLGPLSSNLYLAFR